MTLALQMPTKIIIDLMSPKTYIEITPLISKPNYDC